MQGGCMKKLLVIIMAVTPLILMSFDLSQGGNGLKEILEKAQNSESKDVNIATIGIGGTGGGSSSISTKGPQDMPTTGVGGSGGGSVNPGGQTPSSPLTSPSNQKVFDMKERSNFDAERNVTH